MAYGFEVCNNDNDSKRQFDDVAFAIEYSFCVRWACGANEGNTNGSLWLCVWHLTSEHMRSIPYMHTIRVHVDVELIN